MSGLVVTSWPRITAKGVNAPAVGPRNLPWVARIEGTDPKYGFNRRFCHRDDSGTTARMRRGTHAFQIQQPGLYEFRKIHGHQPQDGFILVHEDDQVEFVSKTTARRIAKTLDDPGAWLDAERPDMDDLRAATDPDQHQMTA